MNVRNVLLVLTAILLGACVRVGHIQQTAPIRTASFKGDHKAVAQCVQRRLGGRVQEEGFGEKYVIADSAKSKPDFTHWSVTVARIASGEGRAEWRIVRPSTTGSATGAGITSGMSAPGGSRPPDGGQVSDASVHEFWNPVLDCVAQAKGS